MEYARESQLYLQLEGSAANHKALGHHQVNEANGDYDDTMSNNDDNASIKDLSPGTESNINKLREAKTYAHQMRTTTSYPENNCDMAKSGYDYQGNIIRARNFKEMQGPTDSSEGLDGAAGPYPMETQEERDENQLHRMGKETGNGDGGLRTYPSSEDLNQTVSSEHGGEKITSGSDDEGEFWSFAVRKDWYKYSEIEWGFLSSR